jgi:hypothetical protein
VLVLETDTPIARMTIHSDRRIYMAMTLTPDQLKALGNRAPASITSLSKFEKLARGAKLLYGDSSSTVAGSFDQVRQSFWDPRIRHMRERDDLIAARRLSAVRDQFFQAAGELGLNPDQARRASIALRDADEKPITRAGLIDHDERALQRRFGEDVPGLVQKGYARISKAIEAKPELLAAVRQSGAWYHGDVAMLAAELGGAPEPAAPAQST